MKKVVDKIDLSVFLERWTAREEWIQEQMGNKVVEAMRKLSRGLVKVIRLSVLAPSSYGSYKAPTFPPTETLR